MPSALPSLRGGWALETAGWGGSLCQLQPHWRPGRRQQERALGAGRKLQVGSTGQKGGSWWGRTFDGQSQGLLLPMRRQVEFKDGAATFGSEFHLTHVVSLSLG